MVQKRKILGGPDLIFITLGTSRYPFYRIFYFLDKILIKNNLKIRLIVQSNSKDKYQWRYKNVKVYNLLSEKKIISFIKKAKKIISHGGPGSIFLTSQFSKFQPLIISRLKKYNEHIDDHQYFYCRFLKEKINFDLDNYFILNDDLKLMEKKIYSYLTSSPIKNKLKNFFNFKINNNFIKNLNSYIKNDKNI
ncbi:MAG: hypothetical protein Fur009_6210 [Candidatus Microgenomates bacterium]